MGVNLKTIISKREIELSELNGKKIAMDAYNILFQFLSTIRHRDTGELLRDSKGRVTSHLSGLFYRSIRLMEAGIKLIYVFDGEPPEFKRKTVKEREEIREEARKKWKQAVKEGRKEEIMLYAQQTSKMTDQMIEDSKSLLDSMGIPWIQAPSEGEAQASYLVEKGDAFSVGSQDLDCLLFGSPRLTRNLSITGRRKLPRQQKWIEIKPEIIELEETLSMLGLTREQLVILGILVGTDYDPGVKGIGPKTGLKIMKENKTLDKTLEKIDWKFEVDPHEVYELFMNPLISKKYKIEWKEPEKEKTIRLMVDEHDFSIERIEKAVDRLMEIKKEGTQSSLDSWFK